MSDSGWADDVLSFWFEELKPEQWFEGTPELDNAIRARFGSTYETLATELPPEVWRDAEAALAAVLVLDQFPRNMFRGQPQAFATDPKASEIVRNALDKRLDADLPLERKKFLFMPLMHSEAPDDQERCVDLFRTLSDEDAVRYAEEHRDIIARFGRFPHRNRVLGRPSTEAELSFMAEHKGYGQ